MSDLDFAHLPDMLQSATIARLASRLWEDTHVVAIWLGGSLARGAGDAYSDIDLRVAIPPADFAAWRSAGLKALFDDAVVGSHHLWFGGDALLHHLAMENGDLLDFMVVSTARPPIVEPIIVLGCRDADFARLLDAAGSALEASPQPATGATVRQLVVDFWMNSHKHRDISPG